MLLTKRKCACVYNRQLYTIWHLFRLSFLYVASFYFRYALLFPWHFMKWIDKKSLKYLEASISVNAIYLSPYPFTPPLKASIKYSSFRHVVFCLLRSTNSSHLETVVRPQGHTNKEGHYLNAVAIMPTGCGPLWFKHVRFISPRRF